MTIPGAGFAPWQADGRALLFGLGHAPCLAIGLGPAAVCWAGSMASAPHPDTLGSP